MSFFGRSVFFWVVATQILLIFTPKIGEASHFHEHIFQMGWNSWNHQLVVFSKRESEKNEDAGESDGEIFNGLVCLILNFILEEDVRGGFSCGERYDGMTLAWKSSF